MSEHIISQALLRNLFQYNSTTGVVTRRVTRSSRALAGTVVTNKACNGYLRVQIDSKRYYLHRIIWFYVHGEWPLSIDHINGKRDDNRLINLRNVSSTENNRNHQLHSTNTTGITGVYFYKRTGRWKAAIGVNNELKHLGYFTSIEAAIAARTKAETTYGYHENHGR